MAGIIGKGGYSRQDLMDMPTLRQGQTDDLKVETEDERIWVSRLTKADGVAVPNKVTIERRQKDGSWR